jgi:hypothetical protein
MAGRRRLSRLQRVILTGLQASPQRYADLRDFTARILGIAKIPKAGEWVFRGTWTPAPAPEEHRVTFRVDFSRSLSSLIAKGLVEQDRSWQRRMGANRWNTALTISAEGKVRLNANNRTALNLLAIAQAEDAARRQQDRAAHVANWEATYGAGSYEQFQQELSASMQLDRTKEG